MQNNLSQFSRINQSLVFFSKKLRLSNPWNFKAPFLITVPYLVLLLAGDYRAKAFQLVLASIAVIIGVAGIGYLTNDLGDREKDKLIGKENATVGLTGFSLFTLFFIFFAFVFCPWVILPFDVLSGILLLLELSLFFAYAFPPFRLKEKGLWGIITDSFYAHVIPTLLAAHTFQLFVLPDRAKFVWFVLSLGLWQFILGIRNILFHQLSDLQNDTNSGTRTFVVTFGIKKTEQVLTTMILPFEIIVFIGLIGLISFNTTLSVLPLVCLVYWLYGFVKLRRELKTSGYRKLVYVLLDDLYIQWLPLFVLIALAMQSINYLPILMLHVLLFRNGIKNFLIGLVRTYLNKAQL